MPNITLPLDLQRNLTFVIRVKTIFSPNVEIWTPEKKITVVTKQLSWKLFCVYIRYIVVSFQPVWFKNTHSNFLVNTME